MEMNDILNGLNSCDDDCCDSTTNNCSCGPNFGGPGIGGFPGGIGGFGPGFAGGCGFGSWIWILLILFYCGCGRGGYGRRGGNSCCCEPKCCDCCECCCEPKCDCCCNKGNGGLLSNCSPYLFILVILFLCNNNFNGGGFGNGCGFNGFGGGINPFNNLGCGTGC
ncbi:hypothetical protein CDLVIII_2226 [Clostridium sp. DL-VIII]|uniref:hypothetical protein n=1 Tax=Clostridium sp. DL-VIII TaxID=641107 RepID=UPI00023AFC1A|nr:hypothetical protein [Clostridium sp. DL-VIII]EHI98888.1 hypothetical protein CDLVIII_2226 [Clostridium sp. DL-VIII]